jgi:hypothetical protein
MTTPLDGPRSIGPTIATRLAAGIHSRELLARIGAVGAYRRIARRAAPSAFPVCHYPSLEGALRQAHWDSPTNGGRPGCC